MKTAKIETIKNPYPKRDYNILIECDEFTCLCPKTGQPDFARITIDYLPDKLCVELKSLKLYFFSYRNAGIFHEQVVNKILEDLVSACQPKTASISGKFNTRGGINTTISASYKSQT